MPDTMLTMYRTTPTRVANTIIEHIAVTGYTTAMVFGAPEVDIILQALLEQEKRREKDEQNRTE